MMEEHFTKLIFGRAHKLAHSFAHASYLISTLPLVGIRDFFLPADVTYSSSPLLIARTACGLYSPPY